MVLFTPSLGKTDGNLYNAALNSMWNTYGKERGLFQLKDAKLEPDSDLSSNSICWEISNPKQQFCIFPIKDNSSGTEKLAVLHAWIK